jgi:hypothetical protein
MKVVLGMRKVVRRDILCVCREAAQVWIGVDGWCYSCFYHRARLLARERIRRLGVMPGRPAVKR